MLPYSRAYDKKKGRCIHCNGPEKFLREFSLLTLLVEYLDGLSRLLNLAAGLGHRVQLGSRLRLAAAGAECNGASNGNNESGEFHKRIWLDDSDVYSSKFIKNSQHKFQQPNTF